MSTYNLDNHPPVELEDGKSPSIAFLLSAVFPGVGHLYIGETMRGVATAFFFAVGLGLASTLLLPDLVPAVTEDWAGRGLRAVFGLYVFAVVDAYFTSVESNSGEDKWVPENPRVAAVLNLLTSGFGYFYLGEKTRGVIVFVGLGMISRVVPGETNAAIEFGFAMELLALLIAWDAWRIGVKMRQENLAIAGESFRPRPNDAAVAPIIPQLLAGSIATLYALLLLAAFVLPDLPEPRQADPDVSVHETGVSYRSEPFGIGFELPPRWEFVGDDEAVASFTSPEDDPDYCEGLVFVEALLWEGIEDQASVMEAEWESQGQPIRGRQSHSLGGRAWIETAALETDEFFGQAAWVTEADSILYTIIMTGEGDCTAQGAAVARTFDIFERSSD